MLGPIWLKNVSKRYQQKTDDTMNWQDKQMFYKTFTFISNTNTI